MNENFIASELVKNGYPLHYWRTKSKAEVDFIIEDDGDPIPVEVKTTIVKPTVNRSFRSFLNKYSPEKGFVATNNYYAQIELDNSKIVFTPHWHLKFQFD